MTTPAEQRLCSKCEASPATGKHAWCNACKATYQREYVLVRSQLEEQNAYFRGVDADRTMLAVEFTRLGSAMLSGTEIAWIISGSPRPNYTPKVTDSESVPAAAQT